MLPRLDLPDLAVEQPDRLIGAEAEGSADGVQGAAPLPPRPRELEDHDIGAFASDVAALPRIVTLNDLAIANNKGTLTMDAVAKTFRYLDEEEMAKQRALQKTAKGKGRK